MCTRDYSNGISTVCEITQARDPGGDVYLYSVILMILAVCKLLQTRQRLVNEKLLTRFELFSIAKKTIMEALSGLAHIDVKANDPLVLFREWQQEARAFSAGGAGAFCLATVSRDGKVSARHLILRRLDDDGFVMMSDRRSHKAKELREVPSASMCFLWAYKNDAGESVSRQVRIEGIVSELEKEQFKDLYEKEPLYCKIRSHICNQDSEVDWNELKVAHDELLKNVKEQKLTLPMPDHVIGYKLAPSSIEFYNARDHLIADRVKFSKNQKTGDWSHEHLAA